VQEKKKLCILDRIKSAEKMTVDKLKTYPGFEKYDEIDAKQVIETLECYSSIVVDHLLKR
jgi:hypothetical protein